MATNAIDIVLNVLGAGQTRSAIKGTGEELKSMAAAAKKAADEMAKAGKDDTALRKIAVDAQHAADAFDHTATSAQSLGDKMEKMRNWGAMMAAAGAGGLMLSNTMIGIAQEGERALAKLDAMATKRGEGGRVEELANWASDLADQAALVDDDPINEAAAGLFGFGVNADQIKGIMPGLIGQSRLYNQTLDTTAMAFGKAFASGNAGALKRVGVTMSDSDVQYVKDANTELERSSRLYEVVKKSMDNYSLSITSGMSEGEKAINRQKKALDDVYTAIGKGSQAAQAGVGSITTSIISFIGANEKVAFSIGWMQTMGSNILVVGGSVLTLVGQVGMARLGLDAMGISSVRAFAVMRAGAIRATAAMMPLLIIVGKIALVALAAAAAIYALDRLMHWQEDKELRANIQAGDDTDQTRLDISNKYRVKRGLPTQTMEQFEGDPNADDKNAMPQFDVGKSTTDVQSMLSGGGPQLTAPQAQDIPDTEPIPVSIQSAPMAAAPQVASVTPTAGALMGGVMSPEMMMFSMLGIGNMASSKAIKASAGKGAPAKGGSIRAVSKTVKDAMGDIRITFEDIVIPRGGIDGAMGQF